LRKGCNSNGGIGLAHLLMRALGTLKRRLTGTKSFDEGKHSTPKSWARRIRIRDAVAVHNFDDHITISFPMPRGELNSTHITTSQHAITVEASSTLLVAPPLIDGRHKVAFIVEMKMRHMRRLPEGVDFRRGEAFLDKQNKLLIVNLPKLAHGR